MLYLHGVPTSSEDWNAFLERAGGIAPDLIGFGRSSKAANLDFSLQGLASFVELFVSGLGVKRFKLVAHDWGAAVAALVAARFPSRVERLTLCNPVPLIDGFRWRGLARLWRTPVIGELTMGSVNRWLLARTLRRGCVNPEAWTDERVEAVWQQFDQGTQRAILRLHRSANAGALTEILPKVKSPTLVVWGERDPWFGSELADALTGTLQHAALERIPDAGHWPWLDRSDVIDKIIEFLG